MSAKAKAGTGTAHEGGHSLAWASLACMGVVFGDIGTSPLYTLDVAAKTANPNGQVTPESVLGIVSLIFWSLIVVISIKYAILIMRADNHGEGGILALLALVSPHRAKHNTRRAALLMVGLVGATLLYGDGAITPAISVLSAIEGIKLYAPHMEHVVVPLTVVILAGLFIIQRYGTSFDRRPVRARHAGLVRRRGRARRRRDRQIACGARRAEPVAGRDLPVERGAFGSRGDRRRLSRGDGRRSVLRRHGPFRAAADPGRLVRRGAADADAVLFRPGGLLLAEPNSPEVLDNPFYALAPQWAHFPLIVLATLATVIASQSIISGAYSMTQQAINLGFLPRMNVIHTEGREIGQIYVPFVNWALAAGTLTAVIGFGSSDALAGAFGIAVSLLMVITTLMATFVALHWKHNPLVVYAVNGGLLALDLLFFASTSTKLIDGGWFPLLIAFVISFLMLTWRKGRDVMDEVRVKIRERTYDFLEGLRGAPPTRIPGTAIVLGRMTKGVPVALSHNVNCNRVLHENVVLVAIVVTQIPRQPDHERIKVTPIEEGLTRAELRFGFMEQPDVPQELADAMARGEIEEFDLGRAIYFITHETIVPLGKRHELARWREAIFAFMHRNAQRPGAYFRIPSSQILEIGVEFEI